MGVDEIRRYKPGREIYLHAARTLGHEPERLALVAVHAWDVEGARRAGLVGGWCARLERRFHPAMEPPDVQGDDLVAVVDGLLARHRALYPACFSRRARLFTFPTLVLSIASTRFTSSSDLLRQEPLLHVGVGVVVEPRAVTRSSAPGRATTSAKGALAPLATSGFPMTATSATAGCAARTSSSSSDESHSPPTR